MEILLEAGLRPDGFFHAMVHVDRGVGVQVLSREHSGLSSVENEVEEEAGDAERADGFEEVPESVRAVADVGFFVVVDVLRFGAASDPHVVLP